MRLAIGALLFVVGAQAEPAVQFPGTASELAAPNSGLKVTYFDPGEGTDGGHDYSLRLVYPDGHTDEITVFTHSVDVAWSPSGEALAVTNYVTGNVADCYVVTPIPTHKISLTDVITSGRYPGPAWALQHSARGSVQCDGWVGPDQLRFVLSGEGGDSPRGFHYEFVYDTKRGTAISASAATRKKKRGR